MDHQRHGEDAARPRLVIGNWKMAAGADRLGELGAIAAAAARSGATVVVCPPAPLVALAVGRGLAVGAQDCDHRPDGAFTGCTSAALLKELGASHVILGHSERRRDQNETDATVRAKAAHAAAHGLVAVVCVGEAAATRAAGRADAFVSAQVAACLPDGADPATIAIAYEPVWSIGTGTTPTGAEIAAVHGAIRRALARALGPDRAARVAVLYGGSVSAANARAIMALPDVDGVLVGGASLRARDFVPIVEAAGMAPGALAA